MNDKIRWGILGTGRIAGKMAGAIANTDGCELAAVGSRTQETADAFGKEHGAARCHPSYRQLAEDTGVDIIYVATPHPMHAECSLLCLEHGKPVLSEKPFTVNAGEAAKVVQKAREKKLFLMEAMWTRFLPATQRTKRELASGRIGDLRMLEASFGFRAGWDTKSRLLDPTLAGGGLLDVGVYTISYAYYFLGAPSNVVSTAHIGETGVDEQNAELLSYPGGEIALLSSAVRTNTSQQAVLVGEEGKMRIPHFWHGSQIIVSCAGKDDEVIEEPTHENGFEYQVEEANRCLREGKTESEILPLDETLSIMRTMDTIRAQWGLKYPFEG